MLSWYVVRPVQRLIRAKDAGEGSFTFGIAGCRHLEHRHRPFRKPGRFAACAAHRATCRAERSRFDCIGRCAVWADDQHGVRGIGVPTYQLSVNGSETMAAPE